MPIFNRDLLDDLARRRAVLFIGSGVTSSAATSSGLKIKGWGEFLDNACEHTDPDLAGQVRALLASKDYLTASELLKGSLREAWGELITNEFGQSANPSALHKAIISLDQRIIVTTNFDKLLETYWGSTISNGALYPKVLSKIDDSVFSLLKDSEGKYLLKIHGSVDDVESIVFSRSEYIKSAFNSQSYTFFIESLLLNYTFVFIGFSMEDPAISSLLEMYAHKYRRARPHYMFSGGDVPENIRNIHRDLRKLQVMSYSPDDNHSELPLLIAKLAGQVQQRRKEIVAAAHNAATSVDILPK